MIYITQTKTFCCGNRNAGGKLEEYIARKNWTISIFSHQRQILKRFECPLKPLGLNSKTNLWVLLKWSILTRKKVFIVFSRARRKLPHKSTYLPLILLHRRGRSTLSWPCYPSSSREPEDIKTSRYQDITNKQIDEYIYIYIYI